MTDTEPITIAKKQSKLGLASCAIGIVMFLIFLISCAAYYFQLQRGRGPESEELALMQLTSIMMLPIPIHAFGLILGAISAFFPNRKKLFPILGIISNLIFGMASLFPWLYLIIAGLGRVP